MGDITFILAAAEAGDPKAAELLLPLIYDELRKLAAARMASEKPGQTLQATSLVHEAYVRLVDGEQAKQWNSRGHFFAAAAEAMRRILINRARDKQRLKRGGNRIRLDLDSLAVVDDLPEQNAPRNLARPERRESIPLDCDQLLEFPAFVELIGCAM